MNTKHITLNKIGRKRKYTFSDMNVNDVKIYDDNGNSNNIAVSANTWSRKHMGGKGKFTVQTGFDNKTNRAVIIVRRIK